MKEAKNFLIGLFSPKQNVSTLQMSLTLFLTISLILANIMVVKSIDLFGVPKLANTCAIITFPITYILSDVFSEVYGYKWSRITATWAFVGTLLCSLFFALMIAIPGNEAWDKQDQLINILGNTPQIAFASIIAFWFGDLANDRVSSFLSRAVKEKRGFKSGLFFHPLPGSMLMALFLHSSDFLFCRWKRRLLWS